MYAEDVDYIQENGRWYCGDYYMPIDEDETSRQYVIHNVYLQFFDGELTTVPLEDPQYILDVGTGIGEWSVGMAERYPRCEVFGVDIAPIQETRVPSNVEFQIESAEEEWIRPANKVDLVHFRNMSGAFRDWLFIYAQAFKCIKPGGWIEVVDFDDQQAYQNVLSFYPAGSPAHVLAQALEEASIQSGRPRGVAHMNPQLLIDAGFVDVQESAHSMLIADEGKHYVRQSVAGGGRNRHRTHLSASADQVQGLVRRTRARAGPPYGSRDQSHGQGSRARG